MPDQRDKRLWGLVETELKSLGCQRFEDGWTKREELLIGMLRTLEAWTSGEATAVFLDGDGTPESALMLKSCWVFIGNRVAVADLSAFADRRFTAEFYDAKTDLGIVRIDVHGCRLENLEDYGVHWPSEASLSLTVAAADGRICTLKASGDRCGMLKGLLFKEICLGPPRFQRTPEGQCAT